MVVRIKRMENGKWKMRDMLCTSSAKYGEEIG